MSVPRCKCALALCSKESYGRKVRSRFNAAAFLNESRKVYSYVLRTATQEEMKTEGYRKLQQSVKQIAAWEQTNQLVADQKLDTKKQKLAPLVRKLDEDIAVLNREKRGLFLSSTNSDEHTRMTTALAQVSLKLKQMKGEPLPDLSPAERKNLENMDLTEEVRKARAATYDYYRIKGKDGTKTSFVHDVGLERSQAANRTIKTLDALANKLDLRDPAEKGMDKAQLDLMENRANKEWMRDNGERHVAKMMYATFIKFQRLPAAQEQSRMKPEKVDSGVDKILHDPAFRRMIQKEGLDKVAEYAIQGSDKLMDSCLKSVESVKPASERSNLQQKTMDEKVEIMKNQGFIQTL